MLNDIQLISNMEGIVFMFGSFHELFCALYAHIHIIDLVTQHTQDATYCYHIIVVELCMFFIARGPLEGFTIQNGSITVSRKSSFEDYMLKFDPPNFLDFIASAKLLPILKYLPGFGNIRQLHTLETKFIL
jgi:hypothetical protein